MKFGKCLCTKSKLASGTLMEHLRAMVIGTGTGNINTTEIYIKEGNEVKIGYDVSTINVRESDAVKITSTKIDTEVSNAKGDTINGLC